ncbi:ankyrin repeat domain-containing protein [Chitinibacter bivalviorum]|uniref:Ankyrin repeat domain-containing protein n=1 Tax=Chitinibacter bivalviorum TaxID=2739434 RepID=A0A7H9BJY3_9NEIS|nr:ankyrin repeat domain-containing protein [Chitinibacter bivalviorum]QLG88568.1 ankyrin repeat domain-containing protein [Chitinibacter bivalviorum]
MISALAALLGPDTDIYPHQLEAQYPRILDQILAYWGSEHLEPYISELAVDERGDRQGFPPEVASELFNLYRFHCAQHAPASKNEQAWEHVKELGTGLSYGDITVSKADFFSSAERGNTMRVLMYLKSGIDINSCDEYGKTPLIWAATFSHLPLVGLLLSRNASPEACDLGGYTALHWAAANGHEEALELLLEHGAKIDACSKVGITPLMQAAARGQRGTLRLLLEAGAQINLADQSGQTALLHSLKNSHYRVTETLLQQRASVDAIGPEQKTALAIGLAHSDPAIRQLFTKHRFDIHLH